MCGMPWASRRISTGARIPRTAISPDKTGSDWRSQSQAPPSTSATLKKTSKSHPPLQLVRGAFLAHHGALDDCACEAGREQLDELVGVAPQVRVALDSQPRGARLEEMAGVDGAQRVVALRIERHLGQDANPQAELDVGLDDVRVERG